MEPNLQNYDSTDNTIGTQGTVPSGESVTPASSLPLENQKPADVVVDNPAESLPTDVRDRTAQQFNKLLEKNKELASKLREYEHLLPANKPQSTESYVDSDGTVDIDRLNRDLVQAKSSAEQALQIAQRQKEEVEEREAYSKHPWLNPNSPQFDQQGYDLVVDRVVRKRFMEGNNVSLSDIASEVTSIYKPATSQAAEQYQQSQVAKAQTAPIVPGKGQPRETTADHETLRSRTQQGDSSAIQERLKRAGIIK